MIRGCTKAHKSAATSNVTGAFIDLPHGTFLTKDVYYNINMPETTRIQYYIMCVSAFSARKGLNQQDAFNYLYNHHGIEFLIDCYEAEHTLSLDDAVDDLTLVCIKHGGTIE